jgi:hypothetical protein
MMFYSNEDGKFQLNPSVYHSYNSWALKKKVRTSVIWKIRWLVPYSKTDFEVSCSSSEGICVA